MKVLAIDPGYDRLGIAVLEGKSDAPTLLYSTCITTTKSSPLSDRLLELGNAVQKLLKEYKPDVLAVETLFFNKNAKTAIGVAEARGIVVFLGKQAECRVVEFGPQEIKIAVTGYGKSDKAAVIGMVQRLVKGTPPTAHDDEYDAIAIGVTALAHHKNIMP